MPSISVEIVRFVDEHQPGFVECRFEDAHGLVHVVVEKAPVVSTENLWSNSDYPRPGLIACTVEEEYNDQAGRSLVSVNMELPWHIESSTGQTRFELLSSQVVAR
jgi:hypothetical protein